jgi:predicted RNA binding protein YcfA (HicA-like mRNA interferase family)
MTSHVTFTQLDRILQQLGFQKTVIRGMGVAYRHAPTDTLFPVRPHRANEVVPDYLLAAARSQFDGRGIIDAAGFEDLLKAAAA